MSDACRKLNVIKFIGEYFRSHPRLTAGYTVSMLCFPLGVVVIPALLGIIMDKIKSKVPFTEWRYLLVWALMIFLVLLGAYMIGIYLDAYLSTDLQSHVRRRVYKDVIEAHAHNFKTLQVSSIVSKVLKLPVGVIEVVTKWRDNIIPSIVTVTAIIGYFYYMDWKLGLIMTALMGLVVIVMWVSSFVCMYGMVAADYEHDAIHENMGDVLDNLMHVYLSNAADEELERLDALQRDHLVNMKRALHCANHFTSLLKIFLGIAVAVVIIYAWRQYSKDILPASSLISLMFILMTSRSIIYNALTVWPRLMFNTGLLFKMQYYMNRLITQSCTHRQMERVDVDVDALLTTCSQGIEFSDVTFMYPGRRVKALDNVSFQVRRGDMVRVTGHIGSGKSTIALLSLGLYPFEGDVRICGHDVRKLSRASLSRLISYIPQNPRLLDRTVYENLSFGTNHSREAVRKVMRDFQVDFVDLDDRVGKGGSHLSTGQRATIYLLRAVLRDSPIVICDEVTSNMDSSSAQHVLGLLKRIAENRTLLFISHQEVRLPFNKNLTLNKGTVTMT